ncbi:MAG TPA: glucan 1,4-alpha-glucosidase [Pyrinomonadaceae bacterium]|nr:glucan 1,4-alpha-glucosidase [Pyrinomonadaceae bacterium]
MIKRVSLYAALSSLTLYAALFTGYARQTQTGNNLAPGAPGHDAQWTNAGKDAVGTSNTLESKVWFTLRDGVMTEVYYPTVDAANVQTLQLIIVDGTKVETESEDTTHRIEVLDPQALTFRQTNTAKSGDYTIVKTYVTDPERNTVLVDIQFEARTACDVYVYYDPSLNNSGMHDSAWTEGDALLASDADRASALVASGGFTKTTNGYFETSDGLAELRSRGHLLTRFARAADGNVVQVGEIRGPAKFTLALGFGREPAEALKNARASLAKGFEKARAEYEQGWHDYVRTLRRVGPKYEAQFDMAAMVLKAHEDKTYRGAMIASLSIPWGGGSNANEPNVGGYHLVWSRDLYQVATAFYALGDKSSADRALDYLFRVQQKADGSFPQNSWLDGRPFWGSLQLDEVAYPLVLAYQLGRTDNETYIKHVRPAADFIVRRGPSTPQERWEEKPGYSPSTIAAEIAGLFCASEIARRNDDQPSANIYLAAADDFARNVERWTATTTGVYGDKNYYLRLSFNDDPNDGQPFDIGNGGGTFDEREIVDAGFLELVRLGVKSPQDPLVRKSLAVVDKVLQVETPRGATFYRYDHDGYGEMDDGRPWNWDGHYSGRGRLWALLAGERGEYELSLGRKAEAARRLDAMQAFANAGRMIPEQVWDKTESPRPDLRFGEGTGSATPLAWSMAQFIRLAANLQEGRNLDTPDPVSTRYSKGLPPRANAEFDFPAPEILEHSEAGSMLHVGGFIRPPRSRVFVLANGVRYEAGADVQGNLGLGFGVERGDSSVVIAVIAPSGATYFRRVELRGLTPDEKDKAEQEIYPRDFVERVKNAKTSPLVEGEDVTFIYRGTEKQVELVGDFTGWSSAGLVLRELHGAGARVIRLKFPKTARLEYKFIADGQWILDPLNPNRNNNGVGGENSNFAGPDYRPSPFASGSDELRGHLERLVLPDADNRKVQVYLPPGYERGAARYPVLYMQDGTQFIQLGRAAEIADRMISEGKLEPFIVVFIDPIERNREYWADDRFADWMAQTLVPVVDSRYRTRATRDARALMGASLGGTISVWTALRHPETFARVGGQSAALQIDEERVAGALAKLEDDMRRRHPLRFYFDAGRYEPLILNLGRRTSVLLAARGYPVTYRETAVGHNYTAWRDRLADALTALWTK